MDLSAPAPVPTPEEAERTEPAMAVGAFTAVATLVAAAVGVFVSFGVGVTKPQGEAILGLVVALLTTAPIVAGLVTRRRVWSPATVATALAQQKAALLEQQRLR